MRGIRVFTMLVVFLVVGAACRLKDVHRVQYDKWIVRNPILTKGLDGSFDNIAVKDPSIVYYNGKFHLFYTAKSGTTGPSIDHFNLQVGQWKYGMSTGYVCASTLEELKDAPRHNLMEAYRDEVLFDPHVFYFEPQQLWYMVVHKRNFDKRPDILPFYMTNPDIEDVHGWSKPQELKTGKSNDEFWIDFWVVCDDENAYMFYSNQRGSVLRMQCPLDEFPQGFARTTGTVALTVRGQDEIGPWLMFEGAQVYHVKNPDQYLFLGECKYDTQKDPMVDAKRRFIIAMTADKLEGPWKRLERSDNEFFIQSSALVNEDGSCCSYSQVSLPGLLRSYNQKFEIKNYNITLLFQAFDSSQVPDSAHYNELPWELAVMKNY